MKIRRIGRKTFGIVLVLLLLFVTFFVIFQHQRNRQARIEVLTTQLGDFNDYIYYLDALSGTSFAHITPHADSLLSQIMKMQNKKGLRLTLISLDGTVIFDSDFPDCDSLSNHLSRNEVKKALREGKGTDICRNSGTLGRPFFYSATYNKKFSYIVRSSLPYNISLVQALSSDSHFLWYALALLVVMVVVLWRYVRRMDKTLEEREELRQNLQLMEQSEMKNRLTQNIAHELKTPLSSIEGYLETMLDHPEMDAAEREHFLRRCYAQSNRLSNLSRDISTLTELSEGTAILQMEPVNMHDLARDVLEDVTPALKKAKMQAFNKIADDVVVNGDRSLLYSVMRNLTDNAIAYAGEGCSIEVSAVRADNHFYRFTFADNGVGVPSAHLEHLFERFYRVDKGRSRKLGGTGLGLAIVKNAVLQHGGSIEIVNREGGGLQCTFFLKAENDV
ncbi:MAG: histidine kinase [Bacteroidales bacterium]|nr:histidine kinase [Bacteroidales bacterium]